MEKIEKIYIIQPILSGDFKRLHDEAIALIESAGAVYIGSCFQNIREINAATFIGSGKLAEIAEALNGTEDLTVLFNGDLSPSQTLNISAALGDRKVIDRTTLILDIFARNAVTSEGKIQVEIAQLKYIYPRLKGKGAALSRLGGGIGSRGPGETQLETDRRHIAYRLKYLESKLKETRSRRRLQSDRRIKDEAKTVALVGYTNTGKSTLLNLLTGSDVVSQNALFVTLDPTARKCEIDGEYYVLIDTVGFIQALPHDIVEAFKSTLEVALNCDLALFVADAGDDYNLQFETTTKTLGELGFDKKYLIVLNKCDTVADPSSLPTDCILISAKDGTGITALKEQIKKSFEERFKRLKIFVPFTELNGYEKLRKYASELSRGYTDDGLNVEIKVEIAHADKFAQFINN
ncbi:MAG: GTPase HflX [Clostridiales bacterium]|nr:GTPase HflX [Clostridiales bacterium]